MAPGPAPLIHHSARQHDLTLLRTLTDGDERPLQLGIAPQSWLDRGIHRFGVRTVVNQSGTLGDAHESPPITEVLLCQDFMEATAQLRDIRRARFTAHPRIELDE